MLADKIHEITLVKSTGQKVLGYSGNLDTAVLYTKEVELIIWITGYGYIYK
jgi:hypothetical protein